MEISDKELYEAIIMIIEQLEYEEEIKYNKYCKDNLSNSDYLYDYNVNYRFELQLYHIRNINSMKLSYFDEDNIYNTIDNMK